MRALVSKFALKYPTEQNVEEIPLVVPSIGAARFLHNLASLIRECTRADLIFISNPQFSEMFLSYAVKLFRGSKVRIFYFDLIMRPTLTAAERAIGAVKRLLLSKVDLFLFIHKDTSGYEKFYGIPQRKCRYVPFKANNYDLVGQIPVVEGDYALSLGASHRDYELLAAAAKDTDVHIKIILPKTSIEAHNAKVSTSSMPSNIEHIVTPVSRHQWSEHIARCRFVVVPLLPGVIQPAGISVYLEAMVFGKAVIVTSGPSTIGILDDSLAALVPPGDVQAMRLALLDLWNNPVRRHALAKRAEEYALSLKDHSRVLVDVRQIIDEEMTPKA